METVMRLLSCGAAGISCPEISDFHLEKTLITAVQQGVWQLCFAGIKQAIAEGKISVSEQEMPLLQATQKSFMQSCILHEQKNAALFEILEQLKAEGIECCLLKGKSLSYMFKHPECRISSDIDLLVSPEQEEKALSVFRDAGFSVENRGTTSNHDKLEHPGIGVVELHISKSAGLQ